MVKKSDQLKKSDDRCTGFSFSRLFPQLLVLHHYEVIHGHPGSVGDLLVLSKAMKKVNRNEKNKM